LGALASVACIPTGPGGTTAPVVAGPVNCAQAEQGLEFFPYPIGDFEETVTRTVFADPATCRTESRSYVGAQYFYSYFDGTSGIGNPGYQPPAESADRCGNPGNHVLHMTGGPFLGWGGGMGIALMHLAQDKGLCPIGDVDNPARPSYCAPANAANNNAVAFAALNVSEWDGVAVWARRGPTSQPLLRVLVGNKDTDDDIAYLMYDVAAPNKPLYCQRFRDCSCQFNDPHALDPTQRTEHTCNYYDQLPDEPQRCLTSFTPGYYCGAPGSTPSAFESGNNSCNTTQCDSVYSAYPNNGPDLQFFHKPCTPFGARSGTQVSLCYDPKTDAPPQPDQQCGDHFTFPLTLTTEWKLYLVPFKQMLQQGFAKRSPSMDLTSVSVVRLTWEAGPIDYYVDDLRFYRVKRD